MKFQKPKGTVDYFPEEMDIQKRIFAVFRKVVDSYGYNEVRPPVIESLELLESKQGEEIRSQIFTLDQRGDEKLALRAELTPSFARMFVEKQKVLQKPVKWYAIDRNWRYEKPQAGRLREFYQLNVECYGSDKPECDAEVISLVIDLLSSLGLTEEDFYVKVNNRKLLQGILEEFAGKNINDVMRIIDKREKITEEEFASELKKAGVKDIDKLVEILDTTDLDNLKDLKGLALEGQEELKAIINSMGNKKNFVKVDLSTARGLAYYTGTVFEAFDKKGKFRALAGGGRYDNMIGLFGGDATPVTGFGMGYTTVALLLQDRKKLPESGLGPDYFIGVVNEDMKEKAFEIADKLRAKHKVVTDIMGKKLGKQFAYANAIKAKKAVVLGPDELEKGEVSVKDMETGKEIKVKIKDLIG